METPLLATKLLVPTAKPGLVARPLLLERLNAVRSYGFVLVSAPAGFGKTTLLSEWTRAQSKVRPAWVSLDEGDNDPVRFWDYFIAALKTFQPGCAKNILPLLHSSRPPSTKPMLTALINDLQGTKGDVAIILDDYHLIETQQIHDGIVYLIEHQPAQVHLVIAARADPPLPLARFRGKGTMLEIRTDDLRFTQDDAAGLLRELETPEVSNRDIAALTERTEGWVVGLKMAALSMKGRKDIPAFIASFTGSQRFVMDYLMAEVLQKQSQELREFLMKTSVLERLSAPLCDALTGRRDSEDILMNLERGHLFIVRLDESRQWYRYEHLFAELLRHQLEGTFEAKEIRQLHLRASRWYDGHGYPDDAIRHCLVVQDWEKATGLIANAADALIKRGEWNTLSGWFQSVPEDALRGHPRAYAQYANVLTTLGRLEAAEAVLEYLERMPKRDESLQGQLTFFRMSAAYHRGNIRQTLELAERAVKQLGEESGAMRARALHLLGMFDIMAGRFSEGQSREDEAVRTAQRAGESWIAATASANLSNIPLYQGKLRQALTAARYPGGGEALARALYERNELKETARTAQLVIQNSELSGYAEGGIGSRYCLAQALMANGDLAGAEAEMAKGDEASGGKDVSPVFRAIHAANRVMFAIRCSDLAAALDWGSQLSELPIDASLRLQHVLPRLLIARGETTTAAEKLRSLYERTMQAEAAGLAIRIRVCQALAAATPDEAVGFLADALKMGETEGFIRTFVDEGKLLAPLLRKALARGITPTYTSRLLTIIVAEERRRKAKTGETPLPPALSERELEVLRVLAAGMSDRQIAAKLVVSLGTAKTHVHHIIDKLEVKDRRQAVLRARDLNLI